MPAALRLRQRGAGGAVACYGSTRAAVGLSIASRDKSRLYIAIPHACLSVNRPAFAYTFTCSQYIVFMRIFFAVLLSAFFYACGGSDILLHNRPLNSVQNASRTHLNVVHIGEKSYLLIRSEVANFSAQILAYNEYDGNDKIWELAFSDPAPCSFAPDCRCVELPEVPARARLYALHVIIQNSATKYVYSDLLPVNRYQDNAQTLHIFDDKNQLRSQKYLPAGTKLRFSHKGDSVQRFFLRHYPAAQLVAAAPHNEDRTQIFNPLTAAARTFRIERDSFFTLAEEGTYFLQTDSSSNKGVLFICTDGDYPKITRLGELIEAMRYITKNEEYERLTTSEDQKAELDRYWLARSPDKERSRSLLRIYFKRAEIANAYFTAEQAGWRTDRGIIFVVFGKPKTIRKFAQHETWFYPQTTYRPAVEFVFQRRGEIYQLDRNQQYREVWNAEILQWRAGYMRTE